MRQSVPMPTLRDSIMHRLYGHDIWEGFTPDPAAKVQGWNGDHPLLASLAADDAHRTVVDVGVWKGQSTIAMASAMRSAGLDGVVIAVDTFLGSTEHWAGSVYFDRRFGVPNLQHQFMSNVMNAGLATYVIPLPQTSANAARVLQMLGIVADIVHVDAAHECDAVLQDLQAYWSVLRSDGTLIGDDYDETWPGVIEAVRRFERSEGVKASINQPKFLIRKPVALRSAA